MTKSESPVIIYSLVVITVFCLVMALLVPESVLTRNENATNKTISFNGSGIGASISFVDVEARKQIAALERGCE